MKVYHFPEPQGEPDGIRLVPSQEDMMQVIETAMAKNGIGLIVTAHGCGKSSVFEHCLDTIPGAAGVTGSPVKNTPSAMLSQLCGAFRSYPAERSAARLEEMVCNAIKWAGDPVLLIDEAQRYPFRCLDELRCIHDLTKVPLVIAGNHSLHGRLSTGGTSDYAPIASRIVAKFVLDASTPADMKALAEQFGLTDRKAVSWLGERCIGIGNLRMASDLLASARDIASPGEIQLSHLKAAAAIRGAGK